MGNHYWNAVNGREFQLPLGASSVPLGKRGVYPSLSLSSLRQAAKPPFHGWEGITRIRNDSARCRRTKTHGGNPGDRPTGCLVFDGLLPRSNAFPQDAMDFFFSFLFFFPARTLCNSRRVTLFFLFFFFDFCFNLSSFGIVLFFLYLVFVIREWASIDYLFHGFFFVFVFKYHAFSISLWSTHPIWG